MDSAIKIRGIEEVQQKMQQLGKNLKRRAGRGVVRKALTPMFLMAQSNSTSVVGVRTGALSKSWKIKTSFNDRDEAMGFVTNTDFKALFIEKGHKIVKITRSGRLRRGRYSGGRTKRVVGFAPAKPMLRPAFDATAEMAVDIAAKEMGNALGRALK